MFFVVNTLNLQRQRLMKYISKMLLFTNLSLYECSFLLPYLQSLILSNRHKVAFVFYFNYAMCTKDSVDFYE